MLPSLLRIMLFLLAGELTVTTLNITFPASLCGMIYFLAWLKVTGHQSADTEFDRIVSCRTDGTAIRSGGGGYCLVHRDLAN